MHKPTYLSDKKKFIMKLKIEEYYRVPGILLNGITSAESVICSLGRKVGGEEEKSEI
jgi:hypothetical protein